MCKRALYHLTEVFCTLPGQSKFRSPGFSAGLALNLLLIFLLIFHLHENNTDFTSITHMQLAFTCDRTFGNLLCWPSRLLFWPPGIQEWSGQENCLCPSAVHSLQCRHTVFMEGDTKWGYMKSIQPQRIFKILFTYITDDLPLIFS